MIRRAVWMTPVVGAGLAAWWMLSTLAPKEAKSAEDPSYLAYAIPVGSPIRFDVEPDDQDLALTVQIETPTAKLDGPVPKMAVETRPVRFAATVLAEDGEGNVKWRGRAVVQSTAGGALEDNQLPISAARILRLPPLGDLGKGGRLVVMVEEGDDADAGESVVVRLVRRAPRPAGWRSGTPREDEHTKRLGDRASAFGWAYLDGGELAALYEEPVARRAAKDKKGDAKLVSIRPLDRMPLAAPAAFEPGETVDPAHAAAWTVRGAGKIRVTLAPAAFGTVGTTIPAVVETITSNGARQSQTVAVGPEGAALTFDVAPDAGLTVAVSTDDATGLRARAFVSAGAVRLGTGVPTAGMPVAPRGFVAVADDTAVDGETEIAPDRRSATLWRVQPGSTPVRVTLAGDGAARILARRVIAGEADLAAHLSATPAALAMRTPPKPGTPGTLDAPAAGADPLSTDEHAPRLSWRLLRPATDGGAETQMSQGEVTVTGPVSRFDVVAARGAEPLPVLEPAVFLAAGAPGAILELSSVAGPIDVSLEAPDDPPAAKLQAAYDLLLESARLRFAPYVRRSWVPFLPDNHADLEAAGQAVAMTAQVRLEPSGPSTGAHGPYVTVEPYAPRTRQLLREVVEDAVAKVKEFHRSGFAIGEKARLEVAASGPDAGRITLDYAVGPEALGGTLRVLVDGEEKESRKLTMTRGRVRLEDLSPGAHEIAFEGAPGQVFTSARPAAESGDAKVWAERALWRIEKGGTLTVPVRLAEGQGKRLHVVLYTDDPADAQRLVKTKVTIDGGKRAPGVRWTMGHTRAERVIERLLTPTMSRWVDQLGGAKARTAFAIRLGADLGPGTHEVQLRLADGPERMHARFFVTGNGESGTVTRFGTEWDED